MPIWNCFDAVVVFVHHKATNSALCCLLLFIRMFFYTDAGYELIGGFFGYDFIDPYFFLIRINGKICYEYVQWLQSFSPYTMTVLTKGSNKKRALPRIIINISTFSSSLGVASRHCNNYFCNSVRNTRVK